MASRFATITILAQKRVTALIDHCLVSPSFYLLRISRPHHSSTNPTSWATRPMIRSRCSLAFPIPIPHAFLCLGSDSPRWPPVPALEKNVLCPGGEPHTCLVGNSRSALVYLPHGGCNDLHRWPRRAMHVIFAGVKGHEKTKSTLGPPALMQRPPPLRSTSHSHRATDPTKISRL